MTIDELAVAERPVHVSRSSSVVNSELVILRHLEGLENVT